MSSHSVVSSRQLQFLAMFSFLRSSVIRLSAKSLAELAVPCDLRGSVVRRTVGISTALDLKGSVIQQPVRKSAVAPRLPACLELSAFKLPKRLSLLAISALSACLLLLLLLSLAIALLPSSLLSAATALQRLLSDPQFLCLCLLANMQSALLLASLLHHMAALYRLP